MFSAESDIDLDSGGAQFGVALPRDLGIGIDQRGHHARQAGCDHRVGAGRRFAVMRARLQRHIQRRAARGLAGPPDRLDFGMRPPTRLGPAAADDDAVFDDHRADRRDAAFAAAACIGCGACVAACKNSSAMLFLSAKVSHLSLLPQGAPERKNRVLNMVAQMDKEGFGACTNTGACEAVCPKEISISNIARLNSEYLRAGLTVE